MIDLAKIVTIVIISHQSKKKVINHIKNFSNTIKIIIIENSSDRSIEKDLAQLNSNVKLIFSENQGYGSAINLARKNIDTDYFIVFNPDLENLSDRILEKFILFSKKVDNQFACLGPRYKNISKKTLIQSNEKKEIDTIKSISGACMFFKKTIFDECNGFDENFFLYFEETDYCKRAKKKGYKSYQINVIKVQHNVGSSVDYKNEEEEEKYKNLRNWHFIWSKYYFYSKNYGSLVSIIYFIPILIRTFIKIFYYQLTKNHNEVEKYRIRLDGLLSSISKKSANKRI